MSDPLSTQRMKWNLTDEHERRKLDHLCSLPLNHVKQHRNTEGSERSEK